MSKTKKSFIYGAIAAEFISNSIAKHQSKTSIGSHIIFLGQVRADVIKGNEGVFIEYSAYEPELDHCFDIKNMIIKVLC